MPSSSKNRFCSRNGASFRSLRILLAFGLGFVVLDGRAEAQSNARVMVSIEVPPIVHMEVLRVDPPTPDAEAGEFVQLVELEISANVEWVLHARAAREVPRGLEWTAEAGSSRTEGHLHPLVIVGSRELRLASGESGGSQRVRIVYRWRDADGAVDPPAFDYLAEPAMAGRS